MNLNKHLEFFNPATLDKPVHIIGVGAVGSRIAELLVRLGVTNLHIWDMDTVTAHNITNQLYTSAHIGLQKTEALNTLLTAINPTLDITIHGKYVKQNVSGYIFMAVDDIELRKHIVTTLEPKQFVKAVFDVRMRLTDAQSYGADWSNPESRTRLLATMQFTKEEAAQATPVSACGTALNVAPTVLVLASYTVANFINFTLGKEIKEVILFDAFSFNTNAF